MFHYCVCVWPGEVQDCLSISEDEYRKIIKVNVITPWFLMKAIAKRLQDTKSGGSIVFLTQIIGAERGLYPGAAAYGTSLGAIHQLVRVSILVYYLDLCPFYMLIMLTAAVLSIQSWNWSCCNAKNSTLKWSTKFGQVNSHMFMSFCTFKLHIKTWGSGYAICQIRHY
jgi:hypothetical protein